MALFKIFKGSDSAKLTNSSVSGYKAPVDGYAYYDTSTKLFYIDAQYPDYDQSGQPLGTVSLRREPINAYKSNIAILAKRAEEATYTNPTTGAEEHYQIIPSFGKELDFSDHTLSLLSGTGVTLGDTIGLVSKTSDGFVPQLPDEDQYNKFFRQDGSWVAPGIPYGVVDSTSTATAFTATVPGITELRDGVAVLLKNGKITSAAGFTININGLGAKPSYSNMAAATADTTIFNVNYTMLFIYDSTRVSGGCWICYRGYNSDTNTIGYQLRTNSSGLPMSDVVYRYRLCFTSADGTKYVPSTTSTSTNATSARAVNQRPIDPFGKIIYYSYTSSVSAGSRLGTSYQYIQYAMVLGYAFNVNGNETITAWKPCYLKCAPQADGSAIMDASTPIVQDLPTTADGKIYIFLGIAYDTTHMELHADHPIYYHDGTAIQLWNGIKIPRKTSDLTNDSNFITSSDAAASVAHTLTIGSYTFNGSADVTIPIYNGAII